MSFILCICSYFSPILHCILFVFNCFRFNYWPLEKYLNYIKKAFFRFCDFRPANVCICNLVVECFRFFFAFRY